MPAIVRQIDRLVRAHMDAMRARVLPLAPGAQEIAVAVEDHHGMVAAIEDVDIVLRVDPDCADFLERPPRRQFRPVLADAAFEIAALDDDRHRCLPDFVRSAEKTLSDALTGGNRTGGIFQWGFSATAAGGAARAVLAHHRA